MTFTVDEARAKRDPRYAAWAKSHKGVKLEAIRDKGTGVFLSPADLVRQEAMKALLCLRIDVAAGLPAEALIDRIDDVLFRLKRSK